MLRIIGGTWRSRRIAFPQVAAIRPTPDRVRETLFNWLQGVVAGSRCLDLFAGSGALGLEALSRGAREVVFVDREPSVKAGIERALGQLGCERAKVVRAEAMDFLAGPGTPFDVVFLDPPFADDVLAAACHRLEEGGWLGPDARIYLEAPAAAGVPELPAGWELLRSKRTGEVGYHLARRVARQGATGGG